MNNNTTHTNNNKVHV